MTPPTFEAGISEPPRHITPSTPPQQTAKQTGPAAPPKPADLLKQLAAAGQARGLTFKRPTKATLLFTQPPDYSGLTEQERAEAAAMFTGLSQLVVLLKDRDAPQPPGSPPTCAWYWWWRGDRIGTDTDELQRLADGTDIDGAADKIAQVLRLVDSSVWPHRDLRSPRPLPIQCPGFATPGDAPPAVRAGRQRRRGQSLH